MTYEYGDQTSQTTKRSPLLSTINLPLELGIEIGLYIPTPSYIKWWGNIVSPCQIVFVGVGRSSTSLIDRIPEESITIANCKLKLKKFITLKL